MAGFFNLKDRSTSLADKLIAAAVIHGIGIMISGVAAFSAYWNGKPLYQAILLGSGVFFLFAAAVNFISHAVKRLQKAPEILPSPHLIWLTLETMDPLGC